MSSEWIYPVTLLEEEGEVHAYSADLPEAIAAGSTESDALCEMLEALKAAVRGRIKYGMDLGSPSRSDRAGTHWVALPSALAAKAAIYSAWRQAGLSKVALGQKIGRSESEVRRILDPDYRTGLDQLDEAARALGGRVVVSFQPT